MVGRRTCYAIAVFLIVFVLSPFGSPVASAEEPKESLGSSSTTRWPAHCSPL